jgi:alkyl hydroperoxide reductase subunit AhpC
MLRRNLPRRTNENHFNYLFITAIFLLAISAAPVRAQSGDDSFSAPPQLIGQAAPPLKAKAWVNTDSLDLQQLRGRVVLLRFLNDSASSAAALNRLQETYERRGLSVVGVYAPTPFPTEVRQEHVRDLAAAQGFRFPIGLDPRWETLQGYWLDRADAELTAATFLIDRKGVIRFVQPDGFYDKESKNRGVRQEYAKLEKEIESLLKADSASRTVQNRSK